MTARRLVPAVRLEAFRALYRRGFPKAVIERCYEKWAHGATPDPCRYGRERLLAVDCTCPGCTDWRMFYFFDQAAELGGT